MRTNDIFYLVFCFQSQCTHSFKEFCYICTACNSAPLSLFCDICNVHVTNTANTATVKMTVLLCFSLWKNADVGGVSKTVKQL